MKDYSILKLIMNYERKGKTKVLADQERDGYKNYERPGQGGKKLIIIIIIIYHRGFMDVQWSHTWISVDKKVNYN